MGSDHLNPEVFEGTSFIDKGRIVANAAVSFFGLAFSHPEFFFKGFKEAQGTLSDEEQERIAERDKMLGDLATIKFAKRILGKEIGGLAYRQHVVGQLTDIRQSYGISDEVPVQAMLEEMPR